MHSQMCSQRGPTWMPDLLNSYKNIWKRYETKIFIVFLFFISIQLKNVSQLKKLIAHKNTNIKSKHQIEINNKEKNKTLFLYTLSLSLPEIFFYIVAICKPKIFLVFLGYIVSQRVKTSLGSSQVGFPRPNLGLALSFKLPLKSPGTSAKLGHKNKLKLMHDIICLTRNEARGACPPPLAVYFAYTWMASLDQPLVHSASTFFLQIPSGLRNTADKVHFNFEMRHLWFHYQKYETVTVIRFQFSANSQMFLKPLYTFGTAKKKFTDLQVGLL